MSLPFFFDENINEDSSSVILDEAASKHVVQVLRMENGERIQLTNGRGGVFTAEITENNRKRCAVKILQTSNRQQAHSSCSIAISPVKNNTRFEWFLEKATEIGVAEIIPLICSRTEKTAFKRERMRGILISAMLQSQQCWLPLLHEPVKFSQLIVTAPQQQKYIAHCMDDARQSLSDVNNNSHSPAIILIGPEGDFTPDEVVLALQNNFSAVRLGETRLRTETAGIVAATLLANL